MTALFGRWIFAVTVVAMLLAATRAAFSETAVVSPEEAIARVITQRVGGDASVQIIALDTAVAPERALHAMPEPGGRAGAPMRFVMMVGRARRGIAVATVRVVGPYARAARAIGRNEAVTADAMEIATGEIESVGLKRLPAASDLIGRTARRDIAPGEALTQAVLQVPPAVRSGDTVVLTVIAGTVQVTAAGIASGSGHEGDIIRVVPQGGRP